MCDSKNNSNQQEDKIVNKPRKKIGNRTRHKWNQYILSEESFYPPQDSRVLETLIEEIYGGYTFEECTQEMFDLLEREVYN